LRHAVIEQFDVNESVRRAAVENLSHLSDRTDGNDGNDVRIAARIWMRCCAARDESPKSGPPPFSRSISRHRRHVHASSRVNGPGCLVRYYAARSLGRIRSPEAINAIAAIIRNDEANQVRIAAADALGSIGGPRAVSILAPLVDVEDRDLARAALNALAAVGHPHALHPIFAVLRSTDPSRRLDAVLAMAARRDDQAVQTLQSIAANDSDSQVSEAAIIQLAAMSTAASIACLIRLTADRHLRETVIGALGRLEPAHIDHVAAGLANPEMEARQAVVEALSRMKHPKASELMSRALEDDTPSVRLTAVMALRRLGSHSCERKLTHMVRTDPDTPVREAAEKALRGSAARNGIVDVFSPNSAERWLRT
jgi:HEAT repeat protein